MNKCKRLLAVLMALVLLVCLTACEKDPNLGKYNCLKYESYGTEYDCEGFYLELKARGKCEFNAGISLSGEWAAEGENLTVTVSLLGVSEEYTGTISNGMIVIYSGENIYTFAKEGSEENVGATSVTPAGDSGETVVTGTVEVATSLQEAMGGSFGTDSTGFDPDAVGTDPDYALMAMYEGDWLGSIYFNDVSDAYSDFQDTWTLCFARFSFNEAGGLDLYMKCTLNAQDGTEINFRDIDCYLDEEAGCCRFSSTLLYDGVCEETEFYAYDGSIYMFPLYVESDGAYMDLRICMRRVGVQDWNEDMDFPILDSEYVEIFEDYTLEEIAEAYEFDPSEIPEATNVSGYMN